MKITGIILSLCCAFHMPLAQAQDKGSDGGGRYANPLTSYSLPDPSVIRASDGYFYLYATEDIRNLPVFRSADLVDWEYRGTAFSEKSRPDFLPGGGLWAPDINRIGDRYVLYYSMSIWGQEWTCGIGCAVSDTPEGPFEDCGKMFDSSGIGVRNSIDPFYVEENDGKYLFWGSFHGIYMIRLSDDGLSVRPGAKPRKVAGTAYEAACVYKRDGYYYLLASIGTCCEGLDSTYTLVVGRSRSLTGPYVNREGEDMLDNRHEVLLHGSEAFVGTGHNSEIVTDAVGDTWLLYHAVDVVRPEGRKLMLDRIRWKDGWPWVGRGVPSREAPAPVFGEASQPVSPSGSLCRLLK